MNFNIKDIAWDKEEGTYTDKKNKLNPQFISNE
jgi:hypothetical protein